MIALDTETAGKDFNHGSRPFLVTVCGADGQAEYWEWDVDPLTREVKVPREALRQIKERVDQADRVVMHNCKFDVRALASVGLEDWDWSKTEDTGVAGHVLDSLMPHDLTSMVIRYLGVNISKHEETLKQAVLEARRYCSTNLPEWRIAKAGMEDLPSARGELWRNDYWLPRTLAKHLWEGSRAYRIWMRESESIRRGGDKGGLFEKRMKDLRAQVYLEQGWDYRPPGTKGPGDEGHIYWSVLSDYAVEDSTATAALWQAVLMKMEARPHLLKHYRERMRFTRVVYNIERAGVTYSTKRLEALKGRFEADRGRLHAECLDVAAGLGAELIMPAGSAVNNSLKSFCFDVLKLEPVRGAKSKSDGPSLAGEVLDGYLKELDPAGVAHRFVSALLRKRSRDTALGYMEQYERFSVPHPSHPAYRVLNPGLNVIGSRTLRLTSSNPNEQNISKKKEANLRRAFGPAPGREWWSLDAKNIELRIPFYKSGEEEMIALFERPDDPPYKGSNHVLVFSVLWPELWEQALREAGPGEAANYVKKTWADTYYQWTKNGNFAVQYGAVDRKGGGGTADRAYHQVGAHAKIKQRFTKLEKLNAECIRFAERHGYVETFPTRWLDPDRGYPLVIHREGGRVQPTLPLSYKVQGTAMELEAHGMVRCEGLLEDWRRRGFEAYMVIQVHDEVVFDLPRGTDPVTNPGRSNLGRVRELQRLLEQGGDDIGLPTPFGVEYNSTTWADGVTL